MQETNPNKQTNKKNLHFLKTRKQNFRDFSLTLHDSAAVTGWLIMNSCEWPASIKNLMSLEMEVNPEKGPISSSLGFFSSTTSAKLALVLFLSILTSPAPKLWPNLFTKSLLEQSVRLVHHFFCLNSNSIYCQCWILISVPFIYRNK